MDLGLELQKTNVGIKIRQKGSFVFFGPNLPKNRTRFRNSKKIMPEYKSVSSTDNFDFFSLNLPKNEFLGRNFQNLTPDSESALPRYHFQAKGTISIFFDPNLPKN